MLKRFQFPLWQQILAGLTLGIILGLIMGDSASVFKPFGDIFINAIRMMVVPLIFTAVVCAIISLQSGKKMAKVSAKGIGIYVVTTAIAAILGLSLATFVAPGNAVDFDLDNAKQTSQQTLDDSPPSLVDTFVNIIPSNPVLAFAEANILQIVVFGLILGISILLAGEPAVPVARLFQAFLPVVFKLCHIIMKFAPIGVFALMAHVTGEFGLKALIPLFKLLAVIYVACFIQWLFFGVALFVTTRLNPIMFYKKALNVLTFAFTTSSSAATLPLTINAASTHLGVSKGYANFLLPIGASINLNGLSIYLGSVAVFAANYIGVELTLTQYIIVAMTIVLSSMGAGGVPGTGLIVMGAVLASVGLPIQLILLIAAIDRLSDMINTVTNVLGDLFTTTVVAHFDGELDKSIYDTPNPS